jgi:membrane fusion protein (multidrug efflux system)
MKIRKPLKTLQNSIFYLALIGVTLCGCSGDDPAESSGSKDVSTVQKSSPEYVTQKIVLQSLSDEVHALGTVQAHQEVEISPEISGKIKKVHVCVGDQVERGDLLVEIDDEARRIALQQKKALFEKALATRKKAYRDAEKGVTLFGKGVISDSESDDIQLDKQVADADLALAKADIMKAEKALRDTTLRAPFDGKIALEDVEIGKMVSPGQRVLTLVDISRVTILVTISELDVTKLAIGNSVEIVVDSLPNQLFSGRVESIGLKAEDTTRTFPVEISVPNDQQTLLPGMVARATITANQPKEVIMVPRKAVREEKGEKVAYILNKGKVEQKRVYLGKEQNDQIIVEKGLIEGDMLIISDGVEPVKQP